MDTRITGTGVALITPFTAKGEVDYEGLRRVIEHVITGGVDYLVVNGTTGESATTTEDEKNEILAFVKEVNKGRKPIMYGLGANNTAAVLNKISKTDFNGVDAILSVCPYYNKPSQEGIYQHYVAIAAKCPVPVMLYNVPGRTGVNMSAATTLRLSKVANIMGIKDACPDLTQALEIAQNAPAGFQLVSGDDMLTVPFISVGGKGLISVLANAYPAQFSSLTRKALNNDFKGAAAELAVFNEINPLMYEEGNPVGVKHVLENLGICGAEVRLPAVKGSARLQEKIKAAQTKNDLDKVRLELDKIR
jgi:4-hydroxy-tetrahydrodipicolinate synthase